ncbi:DUF6538 domain-containing protein [Cupriavidus sp. PET2-C1]
MASPKPQRKIPGLYQRNGVWYLRVMVPDAIKDQPPYNGNRLRCNVSLKTRDPEVARVEALSLRAGFEAEFLRAKDALRAPKVSEVPKTLAEYIVARARHTILAKDYALRYTPDAARSLLAAIDRPQRFFTTSNDPEVVPEAQRPTEDGSLSEAALDRLQAVQGRLPAHPWASLTISVKNSKKRLPFTHADIRCLFSGAICERGELPEHRNAAGWAAYWLPLMGLYSAARLGELGQLGVGDVIDVNGINVLSIHGWAEGATRKT